MIMCQRNVSAPAITDGVAAVVEYVMLKLPHTNKIVGWSSYSSLSWEGRCVQLRSDSSRRTQRN